MPFSRIQRRALARLQQLACLDVNGPQLIEPLLHELHHLIAFDTSGYFHPGSDGALDVYIEPSLARDLMHLYFEPQVRASEHKVIRRSAHDFAAAVRDDHGPQVMEQLITVPMGELLRSDFYNLALRPAELLDCLSLVLRTPQGAGVGALKLYRRPQAPRFGAEDAALLARLEPWLARILQPGEVDAHDSVVHESAMLVASPQGQLLWTSPQADRLMALAFGPRWYRRAELPPALQALLQRLEHARQGGSVRAPPQLDLRNASGAFSLRATLMAAAAGEGRAAGIHITQRVSRVAQLLPALRALGLPQRQHELAYWLARGLPEAQIATRMGISENTTTYHRRQIYTRLGVQSRLELQDYLFAPA
ncbi:helix-turn-helix transcriptional regulator [Acidovorax sp. sif1233]|uniref:helix-turn-helix transcriptional regulator n=1 Tax=unclassified Acidovorax TaxID=2684926 RepID=UPI001C44C687|nr:MULTISPECIES: helix-turn-helix transcriptional regulator [unclassified Acidovorax]MBV7426942.1 helix-turn-helix transcriptional regulator [Acidovorax sp. sif0732]MBV7448067.1 helix-turn-helix transcriptional regulator [Acidovorax sp. sif0715]MBV7455111.1 helix-turn-helix transcriptional regulator [Acidovorax sp. sif1233]